MSKIKFYRCKKCGAVIAALKECSCNCLSCCGENMEELIPNTNDGAVEKHVPVVELATDPCRLTKLPVGMIKIGAVEHPMTEEHHIEWICVLRDDKAYFHFLKPTDKPEVKSLVPHNSEVYVYCNIHGLWTKKM